MLNLISIDMDFVTFDMAKKLKEKGFTLLEPEIIGKFDSDGLFHSQLYINFTETMDLDEIIAPTIPQVLEWLRDDRYFHVSPDLINDYSVDDDGNICEEWTYWSYSIHHIIDGPIYRDYNQFDHIEYQSWKAAALEGITHVLDNLI